MAVVTDHAAVIRRTWSTYATATDLRDGKAALDALVAERDAMGYSILGLTRRLEAAEAERDRYKAALGNVGGTLAAFADGKTPPLVALGLIEKEVREALRD